MCLKGYASNPSKPGVSKSFYTVGLITFMGLLRAGTDVIKLEVRSLSRWWSETSTFSGIQMTKKKMQIPITFSWYRRAKLSCRPPFQQCCFCWDIALQFSSWEAFCKVIPQQKTHCWKGSSHDNWAFPAPQQFLPSPFLTPHGLPLPPYHSLPSETSFTLSFPMP